MPTTFAIGAEVGTVVAGCDRDAGVRIIVVAAEGWDAVSASSTP